MRKLVEAGMSLASFRSADAAIQEVGHRPPAIAIGKLEELSRLVLRYLQLPVLAASLELSVAQWHHFALFFQSDLSQNIQVEQFILQGYAPWRIFQSRVLGPWLEKFLGLIFGFTLEIAHMIIATSILTLCGV